MAVDGPALSGLSILLPRGRKSPDALCELVEAAGAALRTLPLMEIRALDPGEGGSSNPPPLAESLHRADVMIFVSGNAAREFLRRVDEAGCPVPRVPLFAVGESTARVLQDAGLPVTYPPREANTEGLLALPGLRNVRGLRVLICRGRGGRTALKEGLEQRGATVDYLELYERVVNDSCSGEFSDALRCHAFDVVVAQSGAQVDALVCCAGAGLQRQLRACPLLVPGERVGALARDQGFDEIIVAGTALPETMVAALVDWYTRKKQAG